MKYRVRHTQRENLTVLFNTAYATRPPVFDIYSVQMRLMPFVWVTIQEFSALKGQSQKAKEAAYWLLNCIKYSRV